MPELKVKLEEKLEVKLEEKLEVNTTKLSK
jgi:hypothetical protein